MATRRITIDLEEDVHQRFVMAKLRLRAKSLQALMIEATERFISSPSTKDLQHPADLSQKETGLSSRDGPAPTISPEQIREIEDAYAARLLARVEASDRGRQVHRSRRKQKAGKVG